MLAGGEITVTDAARTLAHAVIDPKAPRFAEPALRLMRLTTVGLLPSTIRDGYLLTLAKHQNEREGEGEVTCAHTSRKMTGWGLFPSRGVLSYDIRVPS
jgi:uncharacterized protein (DUF2236 family)